MHKNLLKQKDTVLLIIDIQEKFKKIIPDSPELINNTIKLIKAAKLMDIPIVYTEQYPKGVGHTVEELKVLLDNATCLEKLTFSCCGDEKIKDHLRSLNKKQVIVCGIEAHICVNQTVHDLIDTRYQPHVIKEAVSSRTAFNKTVGIEKMSKAGAVISCVEMALFELMVGSKHEKFKEVQKLII